MTLEIEKAEDTEYFNRILNSFDRLIVHNAKNIDGINFSGKKYFAPGFLMETDYQNWTTRWADIRASVDGIMAEDLGMVHYCVEREIPFITGQGLNITNNEALNFFQEKAETVFLSKELSGAELSDLASRTDKPVEVQVYGPERVMQLRFCPYSVLKKCGDNSQCCHCEFSKGYYLEDKKGIQYAFSAEGNWYNLYSPINSLLDHLEELKEMGIDDFRISLMGVQSPIEELKRLENGQTLSDPSPNHYRYFEGIE